MNDQMTNGKRKRSSLSTAAVKRFRHGAPSFSRQRRESAALSEERRDFSRNKSTRSPETSPRPSVSQPGDFHQEEQDSPHHDTSSDCSSPPYSLSGLPPSSSKLAGTASDSVDPDLFRNFDMLFVSPKPSSESSRSQPSG